MAEDCIFCKIVSGEVPCHKIWEDEDHLAFLDVNPYVRGHLLVIPKNHSRWVWDIEDDSYLRYMGAVKKNAENLRKVFGTDCVQEVIAGNGVEHSHVHLMPRIEGDGIGEIPHMALDPKPSDEEMKEILDKIKAGF